MSYVEGTYASLDEPLLILFSPTTNPPLTSICRTGSPRFFHESHSSLSVHILTSLAKLPLRALSCAAINPVALLVVMIWTYSKEGCGCVLHSAQKTLEFHLYKDKHANAHARSTHLCKCTKSIVKLFCFDGCNAPRQAQQKAR